MGITGWIFIAGGAVMAGRAVPQQVRARRSGAPADAIAAGAWSSLVVGLGSLATGMLYLRDRGTAWHWLAVTLLAAGLITLMAEGIVSRRRARLAGPGPRSRPTPGPPA
jgi:hypothetical protein